MQTAPTPSMQSLLSPSENSVLQSFFSAMEYPESTLTPREWAWLSSNHNLDAYAESHGAIHKEALAKATKDLMSLEPGRWRAQPEMLNAHDPLLGLPHHTTSKPLGPDPSFPYPQPELSLDLHVKNYNSPSSSSSTSTANDCLLAASQTMHDQHTLASLHLSHHPPTRIPQNASSTPSRPVPHTSSSATSSSSSNSTSSSTLSKRNRASSSTPPSTSATLSANINQKQSLLSPSQKKANHIQSEQKRRANIRRGYEALCETVPALREAIKQEDQEAALMAEKANGRRKRKNGQGKDTLNGEKEKVDGRAGPRSENVVLTKTIEHIQNLVSDHSALLARLHHARSMLPSGHPALAPLHSDPPWERKWKGGEAKILGDGEDEEASSDDD